VKKGIGVLQFLGAEQIVIRLMLECAQWHNTFVAMRSPGFRIRRDYIGIHTVPWFADSTAWVMKRMPLRPS